MPPSECTQSLANAQGHAVPLRSAALATWAVLQGRGAGSLAASGLQSLATFSASPAPQPCSATPPPRHGCHPYHMQWTLYLCPSVSASLGRNECLEAREFCLLSLLSVPQHPARCWHLVGAQWTAAEEKARANSHCGLPAGQALH